MSADLAALAERLLAAGRAAGADAADAVAVSGNSLSIEVRNGALEHAERAEGVDLGLRVLVGRRQACVSASDTRPETIAAMAERAVAMAREAPEDPFCGLADPAMLARDRDAAPLDLVDPEPLPEPDALKAVALAAEAAALAVPGVTRMDAAGAGWSAGRFHLAASNGFSGGYARTGHSVQAVAICGEGTAMERDYAFEGRAHRADLPDPAEIGRLAGERTVAMAGASKPPTGAFPVLYDERVASGLIGHLVQAINGSAIARGASWLKDAMGERVLPAGIDLVEDPFRPRIAGSRPFDGEGLPAVRRLLVEDGILKELDPRPRDRPPARPAEHRERQPGHLGAAVAVGGEPDADRRHRVARGPDRGDGRRPRRHLAARRLDQPDDRRLLARCQRVLGRERRDRAPGQRMHDRRQPPDDARHDPPGERRPPVARPRRPEPAG